MQELLGRLRDVDSTAADAVSVIRYFDSLVEGRAGVHSFLRAAAALSGAVAGIDIPAFRIALRVDPDGRPQDMSMANTDQVWSVQPLVECVGGRVWIERQPDAGPSDLIILERLSAGVQVAIGRTRHQQSHDPACVDVLLDADSSHSDKMEAAQRLGLNFMRPARITAILAPEATSGHVALPPWPRSTRIGRVVAVVSQPNHEPPKLESDCRSGLGPEVALDELHVSWKAAIKALRFTAPAVADGCYGPAQHLAYDDLGVLGRLADSWDCYPIQDADVTALRELEQEASGSVVILEALAVTDSYRQAATLLYRHHSSLQARIPRLEDALGYKMDPQGRLRLAAALALNRLEMSGPLP